MKFLFLLCIFTIVNGQASSPNGYRPPKNCPNNQIWLECVSGSCGIGRCDRPEVTKGTPCTKDCQMLCGCAPPLYLNKAGFCVQRSKC